jgi:uncharacterized protein (TIGR02594 family)
MISAGLGFLGVQEKAGPADNPEIMRWAKEVGVSGYTADSVPWCGLFMAKVSKDAGKAVPKAPLWALNWQHFGVEGGQPDLGDTLVFVRAGGGHVGLYVGEDHDCYHVLGGNQGDAVSIVRIARERLYAVRQPVYTTKPASARPYILKASGVVSTYEQ